MMDIGAKVRFKQDDGRVYEVHAVNDKKLIMGKYKSIRWIGITDKRGIFWAADVETEKLELVA